MSSDNVAVPTFEQQQINYLKSVISQRGENPMHPDFVPSKVRIASDFRGDFPVGHMTVALAGDHLCQTNVWGAVLVAGTDGKFLGIRPDEFEILEMRVNEKKRMLAEESAS